jgi:hypothetical protein
MYTIQHIIKLFKYTSVGKKQKLGARLKKNINIFNLD